MSSPEKLEVSTTPTKIKRQIHARPSPVIAPKINVMVITPDITEQWNKEIIEGTRSAYAIFGYDEKNYLEFASWLQDLLRFVRNQNAIIEAYELEATLYNFGVN